MYVWTLKEINLKCYSITFDGAYTNPSMCTELDAKFEYGDYFKLWFINSHTNEQVFVFFDPVYMIKLIRNIL